MFLCNLHNYYSRLEISAMAELLTATNITRDFTIGDGSVVKALKGVNIQVAEGKLTI